MKAIRYSAEAAKSLRKHANMAARIREKLAAYAADPRSQANNVTALVGVDAKRLRVGGFRVVFAETEAEILVLAIGPRGDVYD